MPETGNDSKQFSQSGKAQILLKQNGGNGHSNTEQDIYILELKKVNEELRQARRAALNLMEDAILSKEALRESEEKYRTLFDTMAEGLSICGVIRDAAGKVIDLNYLALNRALEQQTGLERSSMLGRKLSDVFSKNDVERWLPIYANVANTGKSATFEEYADMLDRWYVVSVYPRGNDELSIFYRDITERKRREQQQSFLYEITNDLVELTNIDDTIALIGEKIAKQFGAAWCNFAEMTKGSESGIVTSGWNTPDVASVKGIHKMKDLWKEEQIVKINAGELTIVNDTQNDPRVNAENYAAFNMRSFIAVPLSQGGEFKFMLGIPDTKPRQWRNDEIELAKELTTRIWARLEKARAEEALLQSQNTLAKELNDVWRLQQISTRIIEGDNILDVYEAILNSSLDIMNADFASIQLFVPEKNELRLLAYKNFHPDSAKYWKYVKTTNTSSWSQALLKRERVIIQDIESNSILLDRNEYDAYKKSGIVSVQSTPLISRTGKQIGMISTHWKHIYQPSGHEFYLLDVVARQVADLIERNQAEEALQKSENSLRTLANAVPQVIWTNNGKGNANYFNQRWYEYTGLTYEQSEGAGWQVIVHPEDGPGSVKRWNEALASGEIFDTEYRLRRYDGVYRWFIGRNVPLKDSEGNVIGWFGSATDIEDLKKTTEALSQSEARLKITMDSASDYGIITMDTERRIEKWSSGASQIFGYTESEVIGKPADIIFTEEDQKAGAPQKEMETARDVGSAADERWHKRKDGSRFYVSGVMRPILNNELSGYVKVCRDMTQQQLFTEDLHRLVDERTAELQRSNEDLRQFAHVASHDLKEPVRKIQTFNSRLIDEFSTILPDKAKIYSEKIKSATNRMISMIEGVLRYSKLSNTDRIVENVNLNNIIVQITTDLEVLIQDKKAVITSSPLPTLKGNPILIYQLFYNLILNSLKFAKQNEPVHIDITFEKMLQDKEEFAKIIVSDNGIGFEAEFNKEIFKPFSRLNPVEDYEGTGLGLALCKKIVERHGGAISAEGEPDKGSAFNILLPIRND